ncbi:MAG: hypothetical protein IJ237_06625 [Oscillospiraceae bacterium]|nr:hypothetical protein [Oscillospiraceae bacterium]
MRTEQELIAALHIRVEALRRKRERQKIVTLGALSTLLMCCLLVMVFAGSAHSVETAGLYAGASLLHEDAGGYVLTAVVSFMTGVVITVILIRYRNRSLQEPNPKTEISKLTDEDN